MDACPYTKRPCGSPGDTGPNGCGLAPENAPVLEFYPKWKFLGDSAFTLIDLEFSSPTEADDFVTKLMLIEQYSEGISSRRQSVEESKAQQARDENSRSRRKS